MVTSALFLVLLLQIKHLFADFFWQTRWMVANKGSYGHPAGLLHATVHGALTLIILLIYVPAAGIGLIVALCSAEMLAHYHIDWAKDAATRRAGVSPMQKRFWDITGTDQALHQATYLAIVAVVFA
ncbi:MAG: DUF3307 domain-containing protein [Pseudomonadota bacterium]